MRSIWGLFVGNPIPDWLPGGIFSRIVLAQLLIISVGLMGYGAVNGADERLNSQLTHDEYLNKYDQNAKKTISEVDENEAIGKPVLAASFGVARVGASLGYQYPNAASILAENMGAFFTSIAFGVILEMLLFIRKEGVVA